MKQWAINAVLRKEEEKLAQCKAALDEYRQRAEKQPLDPSEKVWARRTEKMKEDSEKRIEELKYMPADPEEPPKEPWD
jgi:hypothetical protein